MRSLVLAALVLAVLTARIAAAEVPSGSYAIDIGAEQSILVPANVEASSCETADDVTICLSGELATNGAGVITGSGLATFTGGIEGDLAIGFTGKVAGAATRPRVSLSLDLTGELTSDGVTLDVEASSRTKCGQDLLAGGFACVGKMKLCAFYHGQRVGCESGLINFEIEDDGGPWQLRLDLATDPAGVVSGTAEVELATGEIYAYGVTGKYNARSGTADLRLVGSGAALGSKLRLSKVSLLGGTATGGRLDFQVAGQKGKASLPAAAVSASVDGANALNSLAGLDDFTETIVFPNLGGF